MNKKVIISLFSIFFILGVLALVVYYVRFRQNTSPIRASGIDLRLVSTTTSVNKNDELDVDVYIDTKGMSITGSDLEIKYDPNLLLAESITPGNFLPVVFVPGKITSGLAKIVLGCNVTDPKNGNGILASVKFKVLGEATNTSIYFDSTTAISALGQTTSVLGTPDALNLTIATSPVDAPVSEATATPSVLPTPTPDTQAPTSSRSGEAGAKTGDINGDGNVNIVDIGIIIDNYGKNPIPNPKTDLNNDGTINIVDIGIVIDNYGK